MSFILLIEDNAASQKLFGDLLRHAGHCVQIAGTADDGIRMALESPFDLIIMDIQLPGTDGLTATRILRDHSPTRDVPILAVTAHAMRGDKRRILDAGCSGYAAKPIAYREFLAEVEKLLSAKA